ncbi:MAG: helix-turn-helix domain-containing protein [Actinomycetota bacterium]
MSAPTVRRGVSRPTQADYRRLLELRDGLRRFLRWSAGRAEEAGLTTAQHQLLLVVRAHDDPAGPTIGDVADHLLLRHHSAVELVDRAATAGLVRRAPDADDQRAVRICSRRSATGGWRSSRRCTWRSSAGFEGTWVRCGRDWRGRDDGAGCRVAGRTDRRPGVPGRPVGRDPGRRAGGAVPASAGRPVAPHASTQATYLAGAAMHAGLSVGFALVYAWVLDALDPATVGAGAAVGLLIGLAHAAAATFVAAAVLARLQGTERETGPHGLTPRRTSAQRRRRGSWRTWSSD